MIIVDDIIRRALDEDIRQGDITSGLIIDDDARGAANIIAREDFLTAGVGVAARVFAILDAQIEIKPFFRDGRPVKTGDVIMRLDGPLKSIMAGERVALNFLQRLSGIATLTDSFVSRVRKYGVKIIDTRKTTPNLRFLEKEAVLAGGGYNHRMGLYDGILIKDNHIKYCGGVFNAVTSAKQSRSPYVQIEVETKSMEEVDEALRAGADIIMFDNMTPDMVEEAIKKVDGFALTEVSGGITLDNVHRYAKAKPDFISVGALTHSAAAVDISLLIE